MIVERKGCAENGKIILHFALLIYLFLCTIKTILESRGMYFGIHMQWRNISCMTCSAQSDMSLNIYGDYILITEVTCTSKKCINFLLQSRIQYKYSFIFRSQPHSLAKTFLNQEFSLFLHS